MHVSLEWLKDYIQLDYTVEELTKLLTFSGIEVEGIVTYGDIPDTVIAGKVIECVLMDGSDHLQVCQVDTGDEIVQVVCGAPNCFAGMIGALAQPGSKLGELVIKEAHIRGCGSCGMLCSEKELGLSDEHAGIIVLPHDTVPGTKIKDLFKVPDTIFELEITPNRPDLLGYTGISTDLAASTGNKISIPLIANVTGFEVGSSSIADYLNLENREPELCSRYLARVIRNVTVNESPMWLKLRLLKAGMRPINNVVDITNYVMLETGHPLHAFDYDKLEGVNGKPTVLVRRAVENETFAALDGKEYLLCNDDLVIADGNKPIALAGVIGGTNSHITESTKNIVLEAACFNHTNIRRTAYKYKIATDSSYRFERHLAPETAEMASGRAVQLLIELAQGLLCKDVLDDWQKPVKNAIIPIRPKRVKQVIGIYLSKDEISHYLTQLGLVYLGEGCHKQHYPDSEEKIPRLVKDHDESLYFEVGAESCTQLKEIEEIEDALYFEVPAKRVDLVREIDLIEEVIRLHGMDKVPQVNKVSMVMDRHAFKIKRKAADYLALNGFQEIVNLSFTDPALINELELGTDDIRSLQISLLNPQNSNLSVMRTSLLPQLIANAEYNLNRGSKQIRLFELNKVFLENGTLPKQEPLRLSVLWMGLKHDLHWKNKAELVDFYQLKGIVQGLLEQLGIHDMDSNDEMSGFFVSNEAQKLVYQNDSIAEFGKLKPALAAKYCIDTIELKQDVWLADIDLDKIIRITRSGQNEFKPIPKYPSVERDISFLIKTDISYSTILDRILNTKREYTHEVSLIDEYKGKQVPEGYRSLTFRIIFNHPEKTLTDDVVEVALVSILNNLKSQWDIQLR